jgi:MFS family permease
MVPNAVRGRAAGWSQAGVLGGGVLAGGLAVWLTGFAHPGVTVLVAGILIAAPALVVLVVKEPQPARPSRREHLVRMAREVATMLKQRDVWLAIAFFLSPVSAGALMNLFSAVAVDFRASPSAVLLVVVLGGAMTTAGALVGGVVLDRFDRWRVYPSTGLMAAACVGAMLLAPLKPATYVAGAAAYAFVTGFGYAAFMALALEVLGSETAASGTRFTLLMASSNVPVVYMLRLDGLGHAHFGVRGMLAADAIANATFGLLLIATIGWRRSARPRTGIHDALELERPLIG